ncbi:MAG: 3-oxoacyl-ACP synthase III [Verrucomicrobiota bacterium]|nr:3-oxoacyl-ACP synthase III [Verrucomicrobiota bacterium]
MKFSKVKIAALAGVWPPLGLSSDAIEERLAALYDRLKLPRGRLELMTGIRERRFWPGSVKPSQIAAEAGAAVLKKHPVDLADIDLLIHCGVCRDRLEPATAAYVHQWLKLPGRTQILDISNACLGFLSALVLVAGMIEGGQIRRALLVSGEDGKPLLEHTIRQLLMPYHDRQSIKPLFANLTIGAGAVAAIIEHTDLSPNVRGLQLVTATNETDSSHNSLCQGGTTGADGLEMLTDSEALLEAGLNVAERCWIRFQEECAWTAQSLDRVICHQVGRAHQKRLLERLGIAPDKDYITYDQLGNTGSVALPITLAAAMDAGAVKAGDRVALLGIGSGLSSLMIALNA